MLSDADERQLALRLRRIAAQHGGEVPKRERQELMSEFKVSESTFFRRQRSVLGTAQPDGAVLVRPRGFRFTPEMHPYFAPQRNRFLKDVHRALKKDFEKKIANFPEYEHFTKLVKHEIDTDWYAEVRGGIDVGRAMQQRMLDEHAEPGQRWSLDVMFTHAPINPDGKWDPQWGWVAAIIDHGTRRAFPPLFGLGVPSKTEIKTVIGTAARIAGGMPEVLLYDNAGENLDPEPTDWVEKCETHIITINSHHKNENGKSENFNGTWLRDRCMRLFPNSSDSPVDINKAPYVAPGAPVIEASAAREQVEATVAQYNLTVHSAIGTTPQQAWDSAAAEGQLWLFEVDGAHLRAAAQPDPYKKGTPKGSKTINPLGVKLFDRWYRSVTVEDDGVQLAPGQRLFSFAGNTGRKVRLKYWPDDPSIIEVFDLDGETWLCSAVPHKDVPSAEKRGNAARNAAVDAAVRVIHQAGEETAASRYSTVSRPGGSSAPVDVDEERKPKKTREKRPKATPKSSKDSHIPGTAEHSTASNTDHADETGLSGGLRRISRKELLDELDDNDDD